MIVKVQVSLATSFMKRQVLTYNQDRSIEWQADADKAILDLFADGAAKKYFNAELDDKGVIQIYEEVADPGW